MTGPNSVYHDKGICISAIFDLAYPDGEQAARKFVWAWGREHVQIECLDLDRVAITVYPGAASELLP